MHWRKFSGLSPIGESLLMYWRKSSGRSPMAKVQFAKFLLAKLRLPDESSIVKTDICSMKPEKTNVYKENSGLEYRENLNFLDSSLESENKIKASRNEEHDTSEKKKRFSFFLSFSFYEEEQRRFGNMCVNNK